MANLPAHIPLLAMLIGLTGGGYALVLIEPVPPPPRQPRTIVAPLVTAGLVNSLGVRVAPISTPPGDPAIFAHVRCRPYVPAPEPRPRPTLRPSAPPPPKLDRFTGHRFPAPAAPVFVHQPQTPTTGELDRLRLPA